MGISFPDPLPPVVPALSPHFVGGFAMSDNLSCPVAGSLASGASFAPGSDNMGSTLGILEFSLSKTSVVSVFSDYLVFSYTVTTFITL